MSSTMQTVTPEPAQGAAPRINPALIVPFVNSVRSVFQTMVKVETTVNRPHLKTDATPSYDVSSIIGFTGDVIGNVVISLQLAAAKHLVAAFAGMQMEPGTPDFADAIGELANMIAGGAKKHLGTAASITVPTVIIGSGHQIARLSDVPCLVIPCQTPVGNFAVEVNIKQLTASK
jgi:chemotaxis protein CheX